MQGYKVILKTGRILDYEMACEALKEAGMPFIKQEEDITGIKEAYVQPVMGPGNFFNLLVPEQLEDKATEIISELPIDITTDPDFWHYGANEKSKKNWKIYVWFILGSSAIMFLLNMIEL